MIETLLTVFCSIDWQFWLSLYAEAGLITLLILIQVGRANEETYADMTDNFGKVVMLAVLAWPYVLAVYLGWSLVTWPYLLINWVFSWRFWLEPITFNWLTRLTVFAARLVGK
jgi:hypothetical protein